MSAERTPDHDERWCHCGLAANDPNHGPWHKLLDWNGRLFDDARYKREREFESELAHRDYLAGRRPVEPQDSLRF